MASTPAGVYLDEDVSVVVAAMLQARGFEALTARNMGLHGRTDSEQLEFVAKAGRVLLTHNRVDFERLHRGWIEGGRQQRKACRKRLDPLYLAIMKRAEAVFATAPLKILPAYTGATTIDEALRDPRGARLLWLELLVNDRLDLDPWRESCEFQEAYKKACRWYTMYRTVIEALIPRTPLPPNPGPVDPRDYRLFAEAIRFVIGHD